MTGKESLQYILSQVEEGAHPSDLVELIEDLEEEHQKELFYRISNENAASIIQEMDDFDQVALLRMLTREKIASILKEMAKDDAADLVADFPEEETSEILSLIEDEADDIRGLLKYPEDTAGGIMTTDYIALPENITADEAINRLREIAPEAESIYYVYVVDPETLLKGVLSLRDLIAADSSTPLKETMRENVISVPVEMDQEEVARVVSRYDLLAVPVVDDKGRLLGIITVDDILDVMEEEATEDIYRLTGTGEVKGIDIFEASVMEHARRRMPWLIISIMGGLLSGSVIGAFESTLETIVMLAVFIPVIMDMGGNVGTQSSTLLVRGLATGEISPNDRWRYFLREAKVGLAIGFMNGTIVMLAAILWQRNPLLGVVVGIAMFSTILLAAAIGTLIPMIFNHFGFDPAITAGPFVTTIKDVTGLLVYFGIATMFLSHLI